MGSAKRVLVAMSGGVDSSVAAARLQDANFEVTGLTLRLMPLGSSGDPSASPAPAASAAADAHRVARHLGIEHHVLDCSAAFERLVTGPFVQDYLRGATPSPCVGCNRHVKVQQLLDLADGLGIHQVATGHYARIGPSPSGDLSLWRGRDAKKDQSYFLCLLPPRWLARLRFPLGDSTKLEVRAEAVERGLPVATKAESQELCFAPEGYLPFVERCSGGRVRPGWIRDPSGRPLAQHAGIHRFTVGQRKGLGVALGYPAFVTGIDPLNADVTIGPHHLALASGARLAPGRWDEQLHFPAEVTVKVRSQHHGAPARLEGPERVRFHQPIAGVSPGQVAVAYDGDRVVGGATIEELLRDGIS